MSKPLLIANALEIGYADARPPRQVIAAGLNLNLAQGEYVCLVGPNGCLLYTSPSPRDRTSTRMPYSA